MTDTLYSTTAQFSILNVPTASDNTTTYGPGSVNNFLKSNGTNAYWGAITVDDLPSISVSKITGTLAIANGGTGATTVSEISNQIGARSLGYGTAITSNSDLNSFKDPGNYYCSSSTTAKTISNTPHGDSPSTSALGFLLTVEVSLGVTGNYIRQIYKEYKKTDIWRRYSENGGNSWSLWCRFISSKDIHINYSAGTASTKGYEELVLGNTIASGTAGNTYGRLALFSSATKGSYITAADTTSSTWYNHVLPAAAGWLVTAGNGSSTGAGSTYVPIYVNTSGTASSVSANKVLTDLASTTEASIFAESPRPGVTGTLGIANGGTGATSIINAKDNFGIKQIYYGTCTTEGDVAIKEVTCSQYSTLTTGDVIFVTFTNENEAAVANLKLKINTTNEKPIKYQNNSTIGNISGVAYIKANQTYMFAYDGEYWVLKGYNYNVNNAVTQTNTTGNNNYSILLSYTANTTTAKTEGARKNTGFYYNTSSKSLTTGGSINGLTLSAQTTGFKISGGTTSKTLTINDNVTLNTGGETKLAYYSDDGVISGHSVAHFKDTFSATTKNGANDLVLGNYSGSTTNGSAYGRLSLYSSGTYGTVLEASDNSDGWFIATLPAATGTIAYTDDINATNFSGTLSIQKGGTGATSIAGAREALNAQKKLVYFDQTYSNLTIGSNGWCAITIPDPPVSDPDSELYIPIGSFTPISCIIKNFNNVTGAFFITPKTNDDGSLSKTQYIIGTPGVTIGYLILRFICQIGVD